MKILNLTEKRSSKTQQAFGVVEPESIIKETVSQLIKEDPSGFNTSPVDFERRVMELVSIAITSGFKSVMLNASSLLTEQASLYLNKKKILVCYSRSGSCSF